MNSLTFRKQIGTVALAATLALTPMIAMADGHDGHDDGIREAAFVMRTLEQHKLSIPKLIETAESVSKGVAIGVEVEDDVARHGIEVTLLRDSEVVRINMSPLTGEPTKVGKPEIIHSAIARISGRYESLKDAKVSLREAIVLAEKAEQGVAYRAHVDNEDGWACYEIKVMRDGTPTRIVIDPENGRIVGRMVGHDDHGED